MRVFKFKWCQKSSPNPKSFVFCMVLFLQIQSYDKRFSTRSDISIARCDRRHSEDKHEEGKSDFKETRAMKRNGHQSVMSWYLVSVISKTVEFDLIYDSIIRHIRTTPISIYVYIYGEEYNGNGQRMQPATSNQQPAASSQQRQLTI